MTIAFRSARHPLLALGLVTLVANLSGFVIPFRGPGVAGLPAGRFGNSLTLSPAELRSRVERKGLPRPAYLEDVTKAVHKSITYYWGSDDPGDDDKYRLRVPWHENYLLFLASYARPEIFRRYEFADHRKALERGVGYCSQDALILASILREKGIAARTVLLAHHTVVTARVDDAKGAWWVLDPTCGVVVRRPIGEILSRPESVRADYLRAGHSAAEAEAVVNAFRTSRSSPISVKDIPHRYYFEKCCYALKWLIPFSAILFFALTPPRNPPGGAPVARHAMRGDGPRAFGRHRRPFMGPRLRSLLGSVYVRSWVFHARLFYYMRVRRRLRVLNSEDSFKNTLSHNLKSVSTWLPRMDLLVRPLSVIESIPKDAGVLVIGPRNEYDLILLAGSGFGFRNLRGLDFISYSPKIDLGDMHAMPYPDGTWDVVLCGWTLSYSAAPQKAADEILRVVRDGAVVGIGVEYSTLSEAELVALEGYGIQEEQRLAERINSVEQVLRLFRPHVKDVFFTHDAPLKKSHSPSSLKTPSNVAVIFSVSKHGSPAARQQ